VTLTDGWLFPSSRQSYSAFLLPPRPASPGSGSQSTELVRPREPSQHPIRPEPSGIRPLVLRRRQGLSFPVGFSGPSTPLGMCPDDRSMDVSAHRMRNTPCASGSAPYYTGLRMTVNLPSCPSRGSVGSRSPWSCPSPSLAWCSDCECRWASRTEYPTTTPDYHLAVILVSSIRGNILRRSGGIFRLAPFEGLTTCFR
jgi:hypothetical protein